jgi:hypothetical protein
MDAFTIILQFKGVVRVGEASEREARRAFAGWAIRSVFSYVPLMSLDNWTLFFFSALLIQSWIYFHLIANNADAVKFQKNVDAVMQEARLGRSRKGEKWCSVSGNRLVTHSSVDLNPSVLGQNICLIADSNNSLTMDFTNALISHLNQ